MPNILWTADHTLCPQTTTTGEFCIAEAFTLSDCHVYTDEYDSYNGIERTRSTVQHGIKEWARDDDGDGIREVHTNTAEGMWTGLRNFLHAFRGVHKKYLSGYAAIYECRVNLKRISPAFIAALIKFTLSIVEPSFLPDSLALRV